MTADRNGADPRLVDPQRAGPVEAPFDPLRLCVFATVTLLGWLFGPVALLIFAGAGYVGYARARRAGLTTSRCKLRDTRAVLAYLAVLVAVSLLAIFLALAEGIHVGWWTTV